MKKSIFLLIMVIIIGLLVGCYNYSVGSNYGKLESITFYNSDNEEIVGEYKNYYEISNYYDGTKGLPNKYRVQALNSPAPVENYYCADILGGTDVTVRFKILFGAGYEFYSLEINNLVINATDFSNIEIIDNYVYVDYLCTNINISKNEFQIENLKMKKTVNGQDSIVSGSTWVEERTYIAGFYFHVVDEIKSVIDKNPLVI
ncbi:MAG: hypothetical protein WC874_01360 [Candidatus Izemoplasmatales bacterium]